MSKTNVFEGDTLELVATCALGLEEILAGELEELRGTSDGSVAAVGGEDSGPVASVGPAELRVEQGAVSYTGDWRQAARANRRLRTANRVLVALGSFRAPDPQALYRGVRELAGAEVDWAGLRSRDLWRPELTIAVTATCNRSLLHDARYVAQVTKDAVVDAQRTRWGRRSSVDTEAPDLALRVLVRRDVATLLIDTSGRPLDRRGYRVATSEAPARETLAAACVLAAAKERQSLRTVLDPMCGSGTLLFEAGRWVLGWPPSVEPAPFGRWWPAEGRASSPGTEPQSAAPSSDRLLLWGSDLSMSALQAAQQNSEVVGLAGLCRFDWKDAWTVEAPASEGLFLVNPPYDERLGAPPDQWKRLGDLLKQRFRGWTAVVLAGGPDQGKTIGLRPRRRYSTKNGALDVKILVFDLY